MAEIENLENIETRFNELKELMLSIKSDSDSDNLNNQLYSVMQTLNELVEAVNNIANEKSKPTDEFTILQTNILEVKKELAGMNSSVDNLIDKDLKNIMSALTEKINRLEILTNNAGIDQKVVMNVTEQSEKNLKAHVDKDITLINENLKDCIEYLENSYRTVSEQSAQQLSDDVTLLGTTLEKTIDNLKRSIIDIFSRIEESNSKSSQNSDEIGSEDSIEMLKNGIYNLNVNTEQRFSKLNRLIEEMDIFKKLESFARVNSLPAIGQLKQTLNNSVNDIIEKYSYTLQTSQNRDELNSATQQFRKEVYNSIISMLGNVSEFLVESGSLGVSDVKINDFSDKIEELTSITELNNSGYNNIQIELNDLRERCANIQEFARKFSDSVSDIKMQFTELQAKEDTIKNETSEIGNVIRECTKSVIENSEPDRNHIKEILSDIKKNISILQSGDEESDYTYSMQDIESDIAKIRIYLNELSQKGFTINTEDFSDEFNGILVMVDSIKQQLNKIDEADISDTMSKLKDDVTSISTRINKLLLTSDNSQNTLNESLSEFKELSEQIKEQIESISSTSRFKSLEDSLDSVKQTLNETNSYNNIINQSLIMLAEWVDNAGEMITDIHTNQKKSDSVEAFKTLLTQSIEETVSAIKLMLDDTNNLVKSIEIPEQKDYTDEFNILSERLTEQNTLIEKQDDRLNKLDDKLTTILEFIAKNDAGDMLSRMNDIESKIDKLNKNIAKLTAFVNDEE